MSSLIGHAAAGAAMYFSQRQLQPSRGLAACVLVAIAPDIDYLIWWFARVQIEPRATHSVLFCFGSAALAWACLRASEGRGIQDVSFATLLLASCSHLVLDFMVGVHGLPLLWPFLSSEFTCPVGVLPSAGRLSLTNLYLWRNLLIELVVLLPALALFSAVRRRELARLVSARSLLALLVWLAFLWWSISLQR
jgi:inner membrane protein